MNIDLINTYKCILRREPTQHERQRDAHLTREQLIYNLANCPEKFKQLRSLSGESMKTKIKYSEEDIVDFFSSNDYNVAICLSGHVRNYEHNLANINKFLVKPLNADVFIHTWDSIGTQVKITRSTVGPIPDESNKNIPKFDNFLENVRKVKVENNQVFLDNFNNNSEFYLNDKKYDVVIKMRADYSPQSGIEPKDLQQIVENGALFIPNTPYSNHGHPACCLCEAGVEHEQHVEDICDVFAYSTYEKMKKYFEIYFILDELNEKQRHLNSVMMNKYRYHVERHKNYNLVDIWRDRNYMLNCFYPERLFRMHLESERLFPSKLCGEVVR
jgi:hypothetical protein